jgi:hypothetical protein
MSGILQGVVLDRGPRNRILAGILGSIADKADGYGLGWPSIHTIAHEARCSRRAAIRGIQTLEKEGWILVGHRGMTGRGNFYVLDLKKLGVKVNPRGRPGPMWAALGIEWSAEWGASLAPENRRLKFDSPTPAKEILGSGLLFEEQISGASLAPEIDTNLRGFGRKNGVLVASTAQLEPDSDETDDLGRFSGDNLAPEPEISGATVALEPEISGATVALVRCQNEHFSGANGDTPFNVFNRH